MENPTQFFWTVIASSAGSAALIGLAGFLFKTQIAHLLSKDLEKVKNQYARELEVHKVVLMTDSERIKASQEIRKASALRLLERKYQCIVELLSVVTGHAMDVVSEAQLETEHRTVQGLGDILERVRRLKLAIDTARPFFEPDEFDDLRDFYANSVDLAHWCKPDGAPLPDGDQAALSLYVQEARIEQRLIEQLKKMSEI